MKRLMTVTLPLPTRTLSPNGRSYWPKKAKAVKKYRGDAHAAAIAAGVKDPSWAPLDVATVQCHFAFSKKNRRDADNFLASMKPAFDGLVDAGVFTDDSALIHLPVSMEVEPNDPRVEIRIYSETQIRREE